MSIAVGNLVNYHGANGTLWEYNKPISENEGAKERKVLITFMLHNNRMPQTNVN